MKAVSLELTDKQGLMKVLEAGKEATCEQQVQILARAVIAAIEELQRIEEIVSVITPKHRAIPNEDTMGSLLSALYFAAPLKEREEIFDDILSPGAVGNSVSKVPDA